MISSLSHSTMLTNGRLELGGAFNQGGNVASFATGDQFVIAFTGEESQSVHFDNIEYSGFANVDPDYADYYTNDDFCVTVYRLSYSIGMGILEGLQELSDFELTKLVTYMSIYMGVTLAVSLIAPEVVLPMLTTVLDFVMFIMDIFQIVETGQNIYSTATGTGNRYERARAFAKDAVVLIGTVWEFCKDGVELLESIQDVREIVTKMKTKSVESLKSESSALAQRVGLNRADDLLQLVEGQLEENAVAYLAKAVEGYDKQQLADVADAVDQLKKATTKKLTENQVAELLKRLKNNEGDSVDVIVERTIQWIKTGEKYAIEELVALSTCTESQLYRYIRYEKGKEVANLYKREGIWPTDLGVPKNPSVLKWNGNIKEAIDKCEDQELKKEIKDFMIEKKLGDDDLITYQGGILAIEGWGVGGGIQYQFSLSIKHLLGLKLIKETNGGK